MTEFYWITRLDAIHTLLMVLIFLGTIFSVFFIIGVALKLVNKRFNTEDEEDADYVIGQTCKKVSKPFVFIGIIAIVAITFIPTTKEAFMIYGLGNTIDYIKSSDKIKQLPDKVVDALIRYVDSIEKEENKEQN